MVFITKNIPLVISSAGAAVSETCTITEDRSHLTYKGQGLINIPPGAINVTIAAVSFHGINSYKNITTDEIFKIEYVTEADVPGFIEIPVPAGAYTLETLEETIIRGLEGDPSVPDRLLAFHYDKPTRKVIVEFDLTGVADGAVSTLKEAKLKFGKDHMEFFGILLGFDDDVTADQAVDGTHENKSYFFTGNNVSTINDNIEFVGVNCDLISGSFDPKGDPGISLLTVPVIVGRGEHFSFVPNPIYHEVNSDDKNISAIDFTLVDFSGERLIPNSEWCMQCDIQYQIYMADENAIPGLSGGRYLGMN